MCEELLARAFNSGSTSVGPTGDPSAHTSGSPLRQFCRPGAGGKGGRENGGANHWQQVVRRGVKGTGEWRFLHVEKGNERENK